MLWWQLITCVLASHILPCLAVLPSVFVSVQYDQQTDTFEIFEERLSGAVAWANYTDDVEDTGWSHLTVTTNPDYDDTVQAYAAGVVEGYVSAGPIYMHWMNIMSSYCLQMSDYCNRLQEFIKTNMEWVADQIKDNPDDPYFHQAELILEQMAGLEDGYTNRSSQPRLKLEPFNFLLLQISGDLEDLEVALDKKDRKHMTGSGSCSGLIKLLPGNKDLYVSHDTWNVFNAMIRIMKKYDFGFHTVKDGQELIPGREMSFSSYPGALYSGDDFYVINNGLVTLETTIGNSNPILFKYIQPEGKMFEMIRNMVANRLASTASEWADIFTKYNMGTYNNQWMVVDYKQFTPGKPLPDKGLLYILEQIPGMIIAKDMTAHLAKTQYWPSYNIPYFEEIFNTSGCRENVEKYGDWFTYDKSPRANIFRRDQVKVKDMESMIRLMRYNNFKSDPFSRCEKCDPPYSGENAIAARSDLNPINGTYPFAAVSHRCHGATDMKVTSYTMHKTMSMIAVAGPTSDQQPPFQWSISDYKDKLFHLGQPDIFDFGPVHVNWKK
ncbi:putative phospholipase B-like 2 [Anneissia japonica]|uniref:putative phospholipase B-like 2 n=1 Tax=Anneissia japonica TaxID=1529436 RepID=UPI0014259B31|nr:putative phospholipase B-like 2 [Anneissia japonica]